MCSALGLYMPTQAPNAAIKCQGLRVHPRGLNGRGKERNNRKRVWGDWVRMGEVTKSLGPSPPPSFMTDRRYWQTANGKTKIKMLSNKTKTPKYDSDVCIKRKQ